MRNSSLWQRNWAPACLAAFGLSVFAKPLQGVGSQPDEPFLASPSSPVQARPSCAPEDHPMGEHSEVASASSSSRDPSPTHTGVCRIDCLGQIYELPRQRLYHPRVRQTAFARALLAKSPADPRPTYVHLDLVTFGAILQWISSGQLPLGLSPLQLDSIRHEAVIGTIDELFECVSIYPAWSNVVLKARMGLARTLGDYLHLGDAYAKVGNDAELEQIVSDKCVRYVVDELLQCKLFAWDSVGRGCEFDLWRELAFVKGVRQELATHYGSLGVDVSLFDLEKPCWVDVQHLLVKGHRGIFQRPALRQWLQATIKEYPHLGLGCLLVAQLFGVADAYVFLFESLRAEMPNHDEELAPILAFSAVLEGDFARAQLVPLPEDPERLQSSRALVLLGMLDGIGQHRLVNPLGHASERVFQAALNAGAYASLKPEDFSHFLCKAACAGDLQRVRCLSQTPMGVRLRREAVLFAAAEHGHLAIVDFLLKEGGLDVNAVFRDKGQRLSSALVIAARNGHRCVVERLLEHPGIDKRGPMSTVGVLVNAARNGHADVVRIFLQKVGASWLGLSAALAGVAESGHTALLDELVCYPALDVNVRVGKGRSALAVAAINLHVEMVARLLELGASPCSGGGPNATVLDDLLQVQTHTSEEASRKERIKELLLRHLERARHGG